MKLKIDTDGNFFIEIKQGHDDSLETQALKAFLRQCFHSGDEIERISQAINGSLTQPRPDDVFYIKPKINTLTTASYTSSHYSTIYDGDVNTETNPDE